MIAGRKIVMVDDSIDQTQAVSLRRGGHGSVGQGYNDFMSLLARA